LLHSRDGKHIETIAPNEIAGFAIEAIAEDRNGSLWLGTNGGGVFKMPVAKGTSFSTANGLIDNSVGAIYEDSRGDLWFGTFHGVSILRTSTGKLENYKNSDKVPGKEVNNIYEDQKGNIWLAADSGLTVLEGGQTKTQNIKHYLTNIPVICIYNKTFYGGSGGGFSKEPPGRRSQEKKESTSIWIATNGEGLKRLNLEDGRIVTYRAADGLGSDNIYRIFEDRDKNFWLMSDSGVIRVGKEELNRLAEKQTDKLNCVSYGLIDGLKSTEFNNYGSGNSALKTKEGELWYLTKRGISTVNPERMSVNKEPPIAVIEKVFFGGKPGVSHLNEAYRQKGITDFKVWFTAPTFRSPEKIKFKYSLEGVDKEWRYLSAGAKREAIYKALEPGSYTFKVTACNEEGVWDYNGASL
ncbi:MAG: hypothetical protein GY757_05220, partial [bacterium]|nr:hypothetical protein [bacterium]